MPEPLPLKTPVFLTLEYRRQHTSAYVSIRQHTNLRQHTSAYQSQHSKVHLENTVFLMLTYADVCSRRMQTYADACRSMQTYADVPVAA